MSRSTTHAWDAGHDRATRDRQRNRLLAIVVVVLVIGALRVTRPFTLPLAAAAVLLALLWPVQRWLERRMPRGLAVLLTVGVLVTALAAFGAVAVWTARELGERGPELGERLGRLRERMAAWAGAHGLPFEAEATGGAAADGQRRAGRGVGGGTSGVPAIARRLLAGATGALSGLVFVVAYVILGLLELRAIAARVREHLSPERADALLETTAHIAHEVRRFLLAIGISAALAGIATAGVGLAVGLDLALAWGLVAALFDVVPVLGPVAAVVPPTLLAFVQFDGPTRPLVVLLGIGTLQFLLGWVVSPRISGRVLALSPVGLLAALALWTWMWGPVGALLGAPLTVALVLVGEHFAPARPLVALLRSGSPPAARTGRGVGTEREDGAAIVAGGRDGPDERPGAASSHGRHG